MSLSALDVALLASKCKHPAIRLVSATAEFECDVCGLQASSTFIMFREQAMSCEDCGLLVHEKCLHEPFNDATRLYAFTRRRERKANLIWKTALLPELKAKHAVLEQKIRGLQENLKRLRAKVEEASWNRTWAIKTFAGKFYGEFNPEKAEPASLNPLVSYYAKTPARCRLFFERLAASYPDHKVRILVEANNMEVTLRKDEADLSELDLLETSAEHMNDLKDELQREVSFPMNPAMGVAPKWRMRLSVEGTTIAMGDFFLEHLRSRLKISAGMLEGSDSSCYVKVELIGLEASKKAVFSASVSRFGLSGPALPVSYSAETLSVSFECAFKLRVDYQHVSDANNKKQSSWKVSTEATSCVITNLRHAVEGASIPIPSKVLDYALESLLTYGIKQAVLAVLPSELGDYIVKFGKRVCDFEWRVKLESLVSKDDLKKTPLDQVRGLERVAGPKWKREGPCQLLARAMKKLTPRPKSPDEVWTLAKVMEVYRRYVRDAIERDHWLAIWNEAIGPQDDGEATAEDIFAFIEKLDSKPCSIEVDCVTCNLFLAVRDLSRVVRGVLLRAVSTKSTTSVELREGAGSKRPSPAYQQQQQESARATAQQARAAIYEICSSFEQAVESALSHAVRNLRFGIELVVAGGLLSLNMSKLRMISKLGEEFEAPIPAKWIGDRLLQSGNEGYPWKNTFAVDASSGALKFVFIRDEDQISPSEAVGLNPAGETALIDLAKAKAKQTIADAPRSFGDLIVQVAELEVRIAFDGLVEELLRQQRESLFGGKQTETGKDGSLFSSLGVATPPAKLDSLPATLREASEMAFNVSPEPALKSSPGKPKATIARSDTLEKMRASDDTFIMMRVGFKGNVGAVAKGLGNPRIETSLQHFLVNGPFSSLIRLFREFRIGKSVETVDRSAADADEVDDLLGKIESKIYEGGPDQKLLTSVLMDMDASATADSDLHVNLSIPMNDIRPAFAFVDDVDLVSFVSELIQIVT